MKYFKLILLVIAFESNVLNAVNYNNKFSELLSHGDYEGAATVIKEWETTTPDDPELFPARFNLLFNQSRTDFLVLSSDVNDGLSLVFADSLGNLAGSLSSELQWNDTLFKSATDELERGIAKYPNRLDFRLGLVAAFFQKEDYNAVSDNLMEIIDADGIYKDKWLWTDNEPFDDPDGIANIMQDYLSDLFNEEAYKQSERVALKLYDLHPDDFKVINILGAIKYISKEYDSAIDLFSKAQEIDPQDIFVKLNIARTYMSKGDNVIAAKLYQNIVEDPEIEQEYRDEAEYYVNLIKSAK